MNQPIYKVLLSILLLLIILSGLYLLFSIVPTQNKAVEFVNLHKAILYGVASVGATVTLLLMHTKIK